MNWDDLRVAIAVHQSGSYLAAAARLRVNESTVSRRIARLESELGFRLFEAVDGVRQPTAKGEQTLQLARQMAGEANRIAEVRAATDRPSGTYRLAMTDSVAVGMIGPNIPSFLRENPDIGLQLLASTENVNFSRWEADFAVRLGKPEKGNFIVSKIGALSFSLLTPRAVPHPLLCTYPPELDGSPESRHLVAEGLQDIARCTTKNLVVMREMISTGDCAGILPDFLCGDLKTDARFDVEDLPISRDIWLLMQPHLKADPLARRVADWIRAGVAEATRQRPA